MEMTRYHIIVKGIVQGVGYRFFAIRKANDYGITGWVRNLPDGSVEVVAEGDKGLLNEFIQELKIGPISAHISDIELTEEEYTGKFNNFDVRF